MNAADKLACGCAELGIELSDAQIDLLHRHLQLLAKWNRRSNLTAITDIDEMIIRHTLDSLSILPFVLGRSLLDVGSGGGFPGLPLAIANPQLQVTLLDSRRKRAEFLHHACLVLNLANVEVAHCRIEDYRRAKKFDTLATRAFASLADTLTATAALHHARMRLLAMKGQMPHNEMKQVDQDIRAIRASHANLAGGRMHCEKLRVPFLAADRHLVIIELNDE